MFNKLDKLVKSIASLDENERKTILNSLVSEEEAAAIVEEKQVEAKEEKKVVDEPVVAQPETKTAASVTEPTKQGSDDLFGALQAQLNDVLTELKGLKEQKEVLESEKKELEEKVTKQPFGLHGKVQTKDTDDSASLDIEKMYSQTLKRY
jgi:succinate dehydrogenase/fumarate reductase flavoprotein subunit